MVIPELKSLTKERDDAYIDFVLNGNDRKFRRYCKRYKVPVSSNQRVMACSIYKAVQVCVNIPDNVKELAAQKCINLGMDPYTLRQ